MTFDELIASTINEVSKTKKEFKESLEKQLKEQVEHWVKNMPAGVKLMLCEDGVLELPEIVVIEEKKSINEPAQVFEIFVKKSLKEEIYGFYKDDDNLYNEYLMKVIKHTLEDFFEGGTANCSLKPTNRIYSWFHGVTIKRDVLK